MTAPVIEQAQEKGQDKRERDLHAMDLVGGACHGGERGALEEIGRGVLRPGGLALTARALEHCELGPGARVLDLGCGTGATVDHLRCALALGAIGVDSSRGALERGSRRNAATPLVLGLGRDLPLASESVAAVLAECSLCLMAPRERVLAECWRVLAPGGKLVVTDLYARDAGVVAPLGSLPVACGAGMTTREDLSRELEEQGFRVVVWEDHSPMLAEFAARLIMAGGSLQEVWVRRGVDKEEEGRIVEAVRRARPGYFLLVATKEREARQGGMGSHGR